MKNLNIDDAIKEGIAHSIGTSVKDLPSDFDPKETAKAIDSTTGTLAVWRCTKRHDLPYYDYGGKFRYPLFGIINFKRRHLKLVNDQGDLAA